MEPTHYTHKRKEFRTNLPFDFAIIRWEDSNYSYGWRCNDPEGEPMECLTTGWIIENNKQALVVASSITDQQEDQQRCGDITIPHSAIKAIYRA